MNNFVGRALWNGTLASLASLAVLARQGRRETGSAVAPVNAVSHWLHGTRAYGVDRPTWSHTATGVAVHQVSALLWGVVYEAVLRRVAAAGTQGHAPAHRLTFKRGPAPSIAARDAVAGAAVVTALAALTDLRLVPPRLSPGFEHRLSKGSVTLVYAAFAAGLALAATWPKRPRHRLSQLAG